MKEDNRLNQQISRREFCKRTALVGLSALGCALSLKSKGSLAATPGVSGNRVVWIHDSNATFWDGSTGYYGDYVDQARVNTMMETGITWLTGAPNAVSAWQQIIPNYLPGRKIAIKININNSGGGNNIDAFAAPINAVIAGLKSRGVSESDIYVLEPSRGFPTRIGDPILALYPGVLLWDAPWGGTYGYRVTYNSNDPSLIIDHMLPALSDSRLPDQLGEATYLINTPIIKGHGEAGISLTFKNNFGFCRDISRFHPYTYIYSSNYSYDMNPLIDLYLNPNIKDKTVLIIGDAIFGERVSNTGVPESWNTFGREFPNSLFLSADPVAIDSVMYDFLNAEYPKPDASQLYLERAMELGLGTHDHWNNPTDKQYSNIDFVSSASPPSDGEGGGGGGGGGGGCFVGRVEHRRAQL
jgi:hypothetical protein